MFKHGTGTLGAVLQRGMSDLRLWVADPWVMDDGLAISGRRGGRSGNGSSGFAGNRSAAGSHTPQAGLCWGWGARPCGGRLGTQGECAVCVSLPPPAPGEAAFGQTSSGIHRVTVAKGLDMEPWYPMPSSRPPGHTLALSLTHALTHPHMPE
eukprot:CAMPEP_0174336150 /NCGR_PEP_ID=MMETSP0810-20121108/21343_1 /TAXON_ID=73025 ORGANISM="Eutreptiella gymnastica-like, Strain CCMP1594" /NCGR_SAMPLE_ID=MMETSP0810 /ASSEMBLY_ACC=CAM_ASM_000659 /LENGTH=151 /DNA_ID=CAMNT_0015454937 /DNA_START=89 /DNA_END=542 /DNA_ORIENTATION=-